ncbi:MAG: hypothetical protein M1833_006357 [Piccolia ochrophora]|nr:MAG: hypothetical protein M1833_006357 [Piccolia ochrophora]
MALSTRAITQRMPLNHGGYSPAAISLAKLSILAILHTPLLHAAPLRHLPFINFDEDTPKSPDNPDLYLYLGIAVILVLLGGAFAGLTIALMGQDDVNLQVVHASGEGREKKYAGKVLGLLGKGKHWVLVTLLLSNVITNETLPIVLDRSLGGGWPAVLSSTVLIVIFGEIIPQAICVRYGMQIGAWMSPCVLVLMYILAPVAWPTAKLLDYILGEDHGTVYKKAGLKTLVTLHKTLGPSPHERLNQDEVTIISAVLDLKEKPVGGIMTPMDDVFTMSADTILDEKTMDVILSAGYSRIPIHSPDNDQNFVGMLLVKILITYDPEDSKRVNEFALATLPETRPETSCLDIVNFFQEGKSHMVLVSDHPGEDEGALGVVTLEDVIEELIGEEIIDESDVFVDVHKAIRRMTPAPKARVPKGHVVTDAEMPDKIPEDDLIDITENVDDEEGGGDLVPSGTGDKKADDKTKPKPSLAIYDSNQKASFIRRQSSIIGSTNGHGGTNRGNASEMREQLKHLGPSNLASRPKQTRYDTVKIKRRSSVEGTASTHRKPSEVENLNASDLPLAPGGGVGEGLVNSAGKDASDGAIAVVGGYGSIGRSTPPKSSGGAETTSVGVQASTDSPVPQHSPEIDRSGTLSPKGRTSKRRGSSASHSTLGSFQGRSQSRPVSARGAARSGSITENYVDVGGFKKVVLQTTSSSSSDEDAGHEPSGGVQVDDPSDKADKAGGSKTGDTGKVGESQGESNAKKKKRRKRNKKQVKEDDEDTPLLK